MGNESSSYNTNKIIEEGIINGSNLNKIILFIEKKASSTDFKIGYMTDTILIWPDLLLCYDFTKKSLKLLNENAIRLHIEIQKSIFSKDNIIYHHNVTSLSWLHLLSILAIRFELIQNICLNETDIFLLNIKMSIEYIKVMIQQFIKLGIDVNMVDSKGNTCLHYLAKTNWTDLSNIIIAAGGDLKIKNLEGDLPKSIASRCFNYIMYDSLTK